MSEHRNGTADGQPRTEADAEKALTGRPLTLDYRPNWVAALSMTEDSGRWPYAVMLRDIERMLGHPDVQLPYDHYRDGIASVKFAVKCRNDREEQFAFQQLKRLWEHDLDRAMLSYDYGWAGLEVVYREKGALLHYDGLEPVHPLDAWARVRGGKYAGFQVRGNLRLGAQTSSRRSGGDEQCMDLWGPGRWPAKGLWIVHNRRWDRFYGRSQLFGAWRPWQRLANRDGAEEVTDGGFYRFAYKGPVIRYPASDFKRKGGSLNDVDYDAARNAAREMAEQAKAGFSVALPNSRDEKGNYKWEMEWPDSTMNVEPLLGYVDHLQKAIARGIGVPPELLEASEVGSGWSGRMIPLIVFQTTMRKNARNIVRAFVRQVVEPLLVWNFGPGAFCEADAEIVMPPGLAPEQPGQGQPGAAPPDAAAAASGAGGAGGGGVDALAQMLGGGAGGGGAGGGTPYQGPRGGKGWKDASGKVHYGELSTVPDGFDLSTAVECDGWELATINSADWQPYTGKRGKRAGMAGWKSTVTGRVSWGPHRPGTYSYHKQRTERAMASRAAPKGQRSTPDEAHHAVRALLGEGATPTPEKISEAVEVLLALPMADLKALKARVGAVGGGGKSGLAARIAARAGLVTPPPLPEKAKAKETAPEANKDTGADTRKMTVTSAFAELDRLRNALSWGDDPADLLRQVDEIGAWAAKQKSSDSVRKVLEEAHSLADKLQGGSGKGGNRVRVTEPGAEVDTPPAEGDERDPVEAAKAVVKGKADFQGIAPALANRIIDRLAERVKSVPRFFGHPFLDGVVVNQKFRGKMAAVDTSGDKAILHLFPSHADAEAFGKEWDRSVENEQEHGSHLYASGHLSREQMLESVIDHEVGEVVYAGLAPARQKEWQALAKGIGKEDWRGVSEMAARHPGEAFMECFVLAANGRADLIPEAARAFIQKQASKQPVPAANKDTEEGTPPPLPEPNFTGTPEEEVPTPPTAGFTGTLTDALGRLYHFVDGKRVETPEETPTDAGRGADDQSVGGAAPDDGGTGGDDTAGRRGADVGGVDGRGAGRPAITGGRIVTAREQHTKPADPDVVPAGIRQHLNDHQVQGVAKAMTALDEHGGFLLADGTGVGKTRQELAVALAAAQQGKKVLIVTKSEVIKPDWKKGTVSGSFAADGETMGASLTLNKGDQSLTAGEVHVSTYDRLGDLAGMVDKDTLVIFDESHALKNWGSARAKHGFEMSKAAGQVMYATATPADKPLHIAHLFRAQVFGGRKWEETYRELGMHQVKVNTPNGTINKWEINPRVGAAEVYRRMSGLFDRMTEDGLMLKREISFEGVDVGFQRVEMPPEAHEAMARIEAVLGSGEDVRAKVEAAYDRMGDLRRAQHDIAGDLRGIAQGDAGYRPDMREEAQRRYREVSDQLESTLAEIDRLKASSRSKNAGLTRAQVLMHQRRQQETFKIPHAVEATLADLEEGRQVVVFASRVSESGVGEKGEGGLYSEGTAGLLRKALEEAGVPAGDIADLHGGVTPKKRKEAVEAFQASKARVIIATVESGGTGINLDDIEGDKPRTMVMMTAPFSAVENVQAAGRVWRLKTQSTPRLRYLFGDTEVDDWNASLIAGKMKTLGAAVGGQVGYLDVPDLDVSPDEEVERMAAGKAKETAPYAWPKLTRTKEEKAPVRLTGNTFAHKQVIRDAGGKWEDGAWVVPKHVADELRHLSGVQFSDTPKAAPAPSPVAETKAEAPKVAPAPAPAAPQISTRKVNTSRGERHVHGFSPSSAFWDARKRGKLPDNITVRKDDRTGRWEASIWGESPEEVAETYADLEMAGLI